MHWEKYIITVFLTCKCSLCDLVYVKAEVGDHDGDHGEDGEQGDQADQPPTVPGPVHDQ